MKGGSVGMKKNKDGWNDKTKAKFNPRMHDGVRLGREHAPERPGMREGRRG